MRLTSWTDTELWLGTGLVCRDWLPHKDLNSEGDEAYLYGLHNSNEVYFFSSDLQESNIWPSEYSGPFREHEDGYSICSRITTDGRGQVFFFSTSSS